MAKIEGAGAPSKNTVGAVGDIYVNTSTGQEFKCIGVYTTSDTDADDIPDEITKEYGWQLIKTNTGGSGAGGVSSWNDLTDKPFGEAEVTLIPETEVVSQVVQGEMSMFQLVTSTSEIVVNNTYTVIWNKEPYTCICGLYTENGMSINYIGNLGVYATMMGLPGFSDTGEPFLIIIAPQGLQIISFYGAIQTVTIEVKGPGILPIDIKYLPEDLDIHWEDVKDRPIDKKEIRKSFRIEWDGRLDNCISYIKSGRQYTSNSVSVTDYWCKILDDVPNVEDTSAFEKFRFDTTRITGERFHFVEKEEAIYTHDFAIVFEKTMVESTLLDRGLYLRTSISTDGVAINYITAVYTETDVIIDYETKKLDSDLLPDNILNWNKIQDKPFYEEYKTYYLFRYIKNHKYTSSAGGNTVHYSAYHTFKPENQYTISYDERLEAAATYVNETTLSFVINGETLLIEADADSSNMIVRYSNNPFSGTLVLQNDNELSIHVKEPVITPLPEKFLPDSVKALLNIVNGSEVAW